mgnify:CR=1 FL=1
MTKGVPYFRQVGVEHDVINATDGEYAFIEIELKRPEAVAFAPA